MICLIIFPTSLWIPKGQWLYYAFWKFCINAWNIAGTTYFEHMNEWYKVCGNSIVPDI